MRPISCPETLASNYSLRNNPEERSSHLIRGGSLKSMFFLSLLEYNADVVVFNTALSCLRIETLLNSPFRSGSSYIVTSFFKGAF